jgi:hypothetical protein
MDLKQDSSGHLVIEGNTIPTVTGADEVAQRIRQRWKTVFGEWFLDRTIGVPWFTKVFEKSGESARAILIRETNETPGVKETLSFVLDINKQTRSASVSARVRVSDEEVITVEDSYA